MSDPRPELHAFARAKAAQMEATGAVFKRKLLRFNDVVETGIRYACCSPPPTARMARDGIREAL